MKTRRPTIDMRKARAQLGLPANSSVDDALSAIDKRRRAVARQPTPMEDDYPREWLSAGERGEGAAPGQVTFANG